VRGVVRITAPATPDSRRWHNA